MARKPLRSQLNQIRAWVRQGRTDAWIAHQLDVSAAELREFRRRHELTAEDDSGDIDLRDEIEAEIEAELAEQEAEAREEEEDEGEDEEREEGSEEGERRRKRRRRRRRRTDAPTLEATFDHGEREGYGLWLDPAIADESVYREHWAGQRRIEVTIEPDRIVLRRAGSEDED